MATQLDFEKRKKRVDQPSEETVGSQILVIPKPEEKQLKPLMIDVVVCTKDRPENLLKCISMIHNLIPYGKIFVFEGSLKPNQKSLNDLKDRFGIQVVLVPFLKFGAVRNLVMKTCTADYVAMVDDDIRLKPDWFEVLMREFSDSRVVAVSSKLIFEDALISKLSWSNKRTSGGSGGAAIYDRKAVLELGNFDENVHRGEDMELELRIHAAGKRWLKTHKTWAYHPTTVREFLDRPKANVVGWDFIMRNSEHRTKFMAKRFASTFVMPVYYLWKTFDPRCAGIWFIYKMKSMLYYLSGRYLGWS
jgi:glycosyltransferase involved in cell wall biosynthesis